MIAFFGVSGWGRILVPINFRLNAAEVHYVVEHSGAQVLLVDPELNEPLRSVSARHRFVLVRMPTSTPWAASRPPGRRTRKRPRRSTTPAAATARPKGVQLTHRNLWINAVTFGWQLGVSDRDVFLHVVPSFHANGWGLPYAVTGMGGQHVVMRKVDGPEILRRIATHGVTLLSGAPAVANMILDAARDWPGEIPGRGRVRMVVAGPRRRRARSKRIETELGWECIQIYGLTETSPFLTMNRQRAEEDDLSPTERAVRRGRAGAPALGAQVRIDAQGEVLARGNVVMAGYWAQPEETAEAIRGGWLYTGDGGVLDAEGYLAIRDRKKDVIISGGENISSIEVEDASSHPAVAQVAVIGVPDKKWGETVKALVVLAAGAEATEADLIAHCRAHLAHFKCPTSVEFCDELARTATGKLQKFKLRAPYWEGQERQVG